MSKLACKWWPSEPHASLSRTHSPTGWSAASRPLRAPPEMPAAPRCPMRVIAVLQYSGLPAQSNSFPWTIAASRPLRGLGQQETPDSRQNVRDVDLAIDQPECLKWLRTIPQVVTHDFSTKTENFVTPADAESPSRVSLPRLPRTRAPIRVTNALEVEFHVPTGGGESLRVRCGPSAARHGARLHHPRGRSSANDRAVYAEYASRAAGRGVGQSLRAVAHPGVRATVATAPLCESQPRPCSADLCF
jgi:hypothetical protein